MVHTARRFVLVLLLLCGTQAAHPAPCFEQQLSSLSESCSDYLRSIDGDIPALRSLGRRLEIEGRYERAAGVYRYALTRHRQDKALQQGLIRARSELRDRAILAGFENPAPAELRSRCWTLRWEEAAAACGEEAEADATDWALRERYGDVLRSVGRPAAALSAYRASLALNGSNARLRKKHDTLLELVDLEQAELAATEFPAVSVLPSGTVGDIVTGERESAPSTSANPVSIPRGRYRAVVVGNQNYRHFDNLDSPIHDANAVGEILRNGYGFDVTTVIDATRYELFEALADLRRTSGEYDNVLIYYAGHGYLDTVTKRGYWLPVDAEEHNAANWVSTGDITNLIAGLESRHALVIADSCFSGALTRTASANPFESRQALLERLSARRSRTILTSGGLEPVLDGGNPFSRHSVFADALLDFLAGNDGVVEAGRLFVSVRDRVAQASEQTPQYAPLRSAGHEGGDFIFIRH